MQRPQKIEEKVENVNLQKSFKGEAMLKLRTEKQNKSGFFWVSILLQVINLFEKAPKCGWNPNIQTNPMKNLNIYGNFLRHNWTFKCQIVNCSKILMFLEEKQVITLYTSLFFCPVYGVSSVAIIRVRWIGISSSHYSSI